jgi:hypothetical protein
MVIYIVQFLNPCYFLIEGLNYKQYKGAKNNRLSRTFTLLKVQRTLIMLRVPHAFKYVELAVATLRAQEAQDEMNNGISTPLQATTVAMYASERATNRQEDTGVLRNDTIGCLSE